MNQLEIACRSFFHRYCHELPPLLLGLSGGPDSIALFQMLLNMSYPFEVAHIDHGWREESKNESAYLENMCREKQIHFHLKVLPPPQDAKNLEERARIERLNFFKTVLFHRKLQGVLLAHHADDHAETVLKRIFEGASLPKLKGLTAKAQIDGMSIYRPFLSVRKEEILKWLKEKNLCYFNDSTNEDAKFLRSRLRCNLMPMLSEQFGKEITPNLCRLGEMSFELEEFLHDLIAPFMERIQKSDGEVSLDLREGLPHATFLRKAILRSFFAREQITLSHFVLESILSHLQKVSSHKLLKVSNRKILIHKKKITICAEGAIQL